MTIRRRFALVTALLAAVVLVPPLSASAQTDNSGTTPPPTDPAVPGLDQPLNEVVNSWALAPAGSDATGGVGNRSNLSYVADPGAVLTDAVTLYNLSNVPLVFRIYATDGFNNADGEFDLLEADGTPVDVGSWVDMGAEQVPVPANTQVTIPITITVPKDARPGDHVGAVLASNAAESTGPEGQKLTLDRRTGTQIAVRVNGALTADLALADVSTKYSASLNPLSGTAEVTYTIENRGNVSLGGKVRTSVGGPLGIAELKSPVRTLSQILPGQSVTFTDTFDNVPAFGVVVGKVRLEPTGDGATVASSSRRTIAFALPIALLLLLLSALFGLLAVRAYRRHQQRDAEAPADSPFDHAPEREHQPT
jgi:hypothetical protein